MSSRWWFIAVCSLAACSKKGNEAPTDFEVTDLWHLGGNAEIVSPTQVKISMRAEDGTYADRWALEPGQFEAKFVGDWTHKEVCTIKSTVPRFRPKRQGFGADSLETMHTVSCTWPEEPLTVTFSYTYAAGTLTSAATVRRPGWKEPERPKQADPREKLKQHMEELAAGVTKAKLPAPGAPAVMCDQSVLEKIPEAERKAYTADASLFDGKDRTGIYGFLWLNGRVYQELHEYRKMGGGFTDEIAKSMTTPRALLVLYNVPERVVHKVDTVDLQKQKFDMTPGTFNGSVVVVDWRSPEKTVLCHGPISLDTVGDMSIKVKPDTAESEVQRTLEQYYIGHVAQATSIALGKISKLPIETDGPIL